VSQILISCVGSAGDVHPFIAIGKVLADRGHRVCVLTSPYFKDRIERAGLAFEPIGTVEDYQRAVSDPRLWHPRQAFSMVWQGMRQHLRASYQAVMRRADDDTVLVGSTLAFGARLAQEKHGLPMATVHLSPFCLFSAVDPPLWPAMGWLRSLPVGWRRAIQGWVERRLLDRVMAPEFDAIRAELGLGPVRQIMSRWCNAPDKVICAFPNWFAACQPDWPANTVTTGFPRLQASEAAVLDPLLTRFLQAGPPPIGFTPGSAMAHGRQFFERALAACDVIGARAVLITPYRDQLPATLPRFATHVGYVPFDLLLPKLGAFVHHGGIGTLAQCLALGIPQMITPFAHDQFDNSARLQRLGAGRVLAPTASVGDWSRALMALQSDSALAYASQDLAARMGAAGEALGQIAQEIEALARKGTH
jgi:rhamnosyltransferase subunit B